MKDEIKKLINDDTIILCIGTDRSIADSFAPLIGSLIEDKIRLPVYGSLKKPIHALNIEDSIKMIKEQHPKSNILAIDAAVSDSEVFGTIKIKEGEAISPGAGLGKNLPEVGDNSILGIVGQVGTLSIHNTRLSDILDMSSRVANDIINACEEKEF